MDRVITGLVIDHSQETGKWYVKEVKDETGNGIKPVFFRREKNDLIGRLWDKLRGAESAQRYAAAHINELTELKPVDVSNIVDDSGNLSFPPIRPNKLTAGDLQALLEDKCKLADSGQPKEGRDKIQDSALLVTVISTTNKKELKHQVDHLWSSYAGTGDIPKNDFKRLMQCSLQIASGQVKTNDPKVFDECTNFVNQVSLQGQTAWKSQQTPESFQSLEIFFLEKKSSGVSKTSETAATSVAQDPLTSFMPKGTDLGPDQIFDKKHWQPGDLPTTKYDGVIWVNGEDMPREYQARIRDAFRIHDALLNAVPIGQGFSTVNIALVPDDLNIGNPADVLKTLKFVRDVAKSDAAKQTINALGEATAKYVQHMNHT